MTDSERSTFDLVALKKMISLEIKYTSTNAYFHDDTRQDKKETVPVLIVKSRNEEELRKIKEIHVNEKTVIHLELDAMLARHKFHSDPVYIWKEGCVFKTEIYLYEHKRDDLFFVKIKFLDGQEKSFSISTKMMPRETSNFIINSCFRKSDLSLLIESKSDFEIVWQTIRFGVFSERREKRKKGKYVFKVQPSFSDYYGVSISTVGNVLEIEHKHVFHGFMELPSSRYLVVNKQGNKVFIVHPLQKQNPVWKSAVSFINDEDVKKKAIDLYKRIESHGFLELEVFTNACEECVLTDFPIKITKIDDRLIKSIISGDPESVLNCLKKSRKYEAWGSRWLKPNLSSKKRIYDHYGILFCCDYNNLEKSCANFISKEIRNRMSFDKCESEGCENCANMIQCEIIYPTKSEAFVKRFLSNTCIRLREKNANDDRERLFHLDDDAES